MMIMKLMHTPVPEVANCQFFFTNSHWKDANFSMAITRNTTTANTAAGLVATETALANLTPAVTCQFRRRTHTRPFFSSVLTKPTVCRLAWCNITLRVYLGTV
ncbi:hypothetical protein JZ751_021099 [Albula glossodonta]|uniref:Uncharacterized protein n=1 Tax=Albula glossodonta TaxID=121402 RepID=A0A8T2PJI7_9TELE|nr:hypothetical protein JZ751_021099 [Albula glossodonta]